jgi:hypothetical protein
MGISIKLNSHFDLEQQHQRPLPTSPSSISQQLLQQHQQPIYSNQHVNSPRSHYPADDGFERNNHSISSRKSNASDTSMEYSKKSHQFAVRTFGTPMKCHHCTSLMVSYLFIFN